jgi:hypothetical protein
MLYTTLSQIDLPIRAEPISPPVEIGVYEPRSSAKKSLRDWGI